jgi:hypothetical protein
MKILQSPKFEIGDRVNTGRPPHQKVGRIRRVFNPTPEGMWRYLVWFQVTNGEATRPHVVAFDESELEGV